MKWSLHFKMTGLEGNSEFCETVKFCFPRISIMFPETKSGETLRFKGNKIHWFSDGPVIKLVICYIAK